MCVSKNHKKKGQLYVWFISWQGLQKRSAKKTDGTRTALHLNVSHSLQAALMTPSVGTSLAKNMTMSVVYNPLCEELLSVHLCCHSDITGRATGRELAVCL